MDEKENPDTERKNDHQNILASKQGRLCLFLVIITAVVSFFIYERTAGLSNMNWKAVEGVVEGRNVRVQFLMKVADTKYKYIVNEQTYHQIYSSFSDGWALKEGAPVRVVYNPDNPIKSRLDLGFSLDILFFALVDVASIAGIILSIKSYRQKLLDKKTNTGFEDFEPHFEIESSN